MLTSLKHGLGLISIGFGLGIVAWGGFTLINKAQPMITPNLYDEETIDATATIAPPSPQNSAPAAVVSNDPSFAALSYCDQLDALTRGGKSITDFILASGNISGYDWAVRAPGGCHWHTQQADVVQKIIAPPIAVVPHEEAISRRLVTANSDADLCLISDPCHPDYESWARANNVAYLLNNCNGRRDLYEMTTPACPSTDSRSVTAADRPGVNDLWERSNRAH